MSDDHFTHRCELFDAADMRLAEFAVEDFCEWFRELIHTKHDEVGPDGMKAEFDGMDLFFAVREMHVRPLPDWTEDYL